MSDHESDPNISIELRVVLIDDIWCVEHLEDGQPSPRILDLFDGEHVLPTPWFAPTPREVVMRALRERNPGAVVTAG